MEMAVRIKLYVFQAFRQGFSGVEYIRIHRDITGEMWFGVG